MEVKRILVNFDVDRFSPSLASYAASMAERFEAELVGFSAAVPSEVFVGINGAVAAASIFAEQRIEIERQLEAMQEKFLAAVSPRINREWRQMVEVPDRALVSMGRSVDLVVTGSQAEPNPGILRRPDLGNLILSLGRPVLIASAWASEFAAKRVIIGWKDTRECRRAVADALPFLKLASAVKICAVEEHDFAFAKPSLEDALGWLRSHGVNATGDIVPSAYEGASATLEQARRDFEADLVVTGAYGHSRTQEWFFGGMTRDLLGVTTFDRLMSN